MSINSPVRERARAATPAELAGISWLRVLSEPDRERAVRSLRVACLRPYTLVA